VPTAQQPSRVKETKPRFLFVDGLRGIAALAVVLFHFRGAINETASEWASPIIELLLSYGYLGVDIFFVISGFVISYSIRNARHTPGFLFRFGVRRSIRLDPPYWVTIILELFAIKLGLMLFPALGTPFPSVEMIMAHFVYAQDLLGYGGIISIFWTLCYEIQFYIVFVGALVFARALGHRLGDRRAYSFMFAIGAISFVLSVIFFFSAVDSPVRGLFIDRWYQFMLGYLAMRVCLRKQFGVSFVLASVLVGVASLLEIEAGADNGLSALAIAWLLVAAARREQMARWLSGRISQFFGRISYSLYLIHSVVGWRFIKLLYELHGEEFTPFQAWLALGAGVAVSVLSAWVMCVIVEAPALRLSQRIRLDRPLLSHRFGWLMSWPGGRMSGLRNQGAALGERVPDRGIVATVLPDFTTLDRPTQSSEHAGRTTTR
jgi:peptidoglycan/LPS O-acetylase OafA/YrhL